MYIQQFSGRRAFRICIHWREECPTISRRRAPRGGWGICSSSMAGYRCRRRRSGGLLLVGRRRRRRRRHHQKKRSRSRGGWGAAMHADRRWWSCATATAPTSTATAFTCPAGGAPRRWPAAAAPTARPPLGCARSCRATRDT